MRFLAIFLIIFGIIVVIFPEFLAILIGSFFIVIGVNLLIINLGFSSKFGFKTKKDYVKFGKYKIYR